MEQAIIEAKRALAIGEVPIGAIIVKDEVVIGQGYNQRESLQDPTAHAEIIAIKQAARTLGTWRLTGADLYVTLEPCPMCAGAIVNARLQQVVFGAYDLKAGAVSSLMNIVEDKRLNHCVQVMAGICEEACSQLLKDFFQDLRTRNIYNSER